MREGHHPSTVLAVNPRALWLFFSSSTPLGLKTRNWVTGMPWSWALDGRFTACPAGGSEMHRMAQCQTQPEPLHYPCSPRTWPHTFSPWRVEVCASHAQASELCGPVSLGLCPGPLSPLAGTHFRVGLPSCSLVLLETFSHQEPGLPFSHGL